MGYIYQGSAATWSKAFIIVVYMLNEIVGVNGFKPAVNDFIKIWNSSSWAELKWLFGQNWQKIIGTLVLWLAIIPALLPMAMLANAVELPSAFAWIAPVLLSWVPYICCIGLMLLIAYKTVFVRQSMQNAFGLFEMPGSKFDGFFLVFKWVFLALGLVSGLNPAAASSEVLHKSETPMPAWVSHMFIWWTYGATCFSNIAFSSPGLDGIKQQFKTSFEALESKEKLVVQKLFDFLKEQKWLPAEMRDIFNELEAELNPPLEEIVIDKSYGSTQYSSSTSSFSFGNASFDDPQPGLLDRAAKYVGDTLHSYRRPAASDEESAPLRAANGNEAPDPGPGWSRYCPCV